MPGNERDRWDKADIVLRPVGGLLTGLAVAWVGFLARDALEARQRAEAKTQLYAQLMSAREQADSSLRQSMFNTIVDEFLISSGEAPEERALADYERAVLKLELLAYNFHDALDLAPLFKDVSWRLNGLSEPGSEGLAQERRVALLTRLENVAVEVANKQVAALGESGAVGRFAVRRTKLDEKGIVRHAFDQAIEGRPTDSDATKLTGKYFSIDVNAIDWEAKEVEVRLTAWPVGPDGETVPEAIVDAIFHVGFFDFPMIDNTRLSDGERCAIVLERLDESGAELALVYFPGTRASLKQKPFYDEIIDRTLGLEEERG